MLLLELKHIFIFCLAFLSESERKLRCFWYIEVTYFSSIPKFLSLFFQSYWRALFIAFRERQRVKERERETDRERERHRCERETSVGCLLLCAPTLDWTQNLGMCPDWQLNPWPFGLWHYNQLSHTCQGLKICFHWRHGDPLGGVPEVGCRKGL